MRIIAVDWSGALVRAEKLIWLAEAAGGEVVELRCGLTRQQIRDRLIAEARRDPNLVVGLDFAFSMPKWFMGECGFETAAELWEASELRGEEWLRECAPPFYGRRGTKAPAEERLRRTEREVTPIGGIRPKSVFQIGGAGAVGTGSLRGMPVLHALHGAGFYIWPFCDEGLPMVVEIYPRLLTGAVNKRDPVARGQYLEAHYGHMPMAMRELASSTEDAFDAAVSALVMWEHREEFATLSRAEDPQLVVEGQIWQPVGR